MALRDIIRGAKPDVTKSTPLAKLAPLAIATPTLGENASSNNVALDQPIPKPATTNLANAANAANDKTKLALMPFHFEWFNLLYNFLRELHSWSDDDYQAWFKDLNDDPALTLNCLDALHISAMDGRYGAIEQKDWGRSIQLYKGLTIEQSKIASFLLAQRKSWDDRKLCVECKHLLALNSSWKCGNWQLAGLTTNISGSGLSWHLITLFQRCNGFSGA
jgi:hypothetical protein